MSNQPHRMGRTTEGWNNDPNAFSNVGASDVGRPETQGAGDVAGQQPIGTQPLAGHPVGQQQPMGRQHQPPMGRQHQQPMGHQQQQSFDQQWQQPFDQQRRQPYDQQRQAFDQPPLVGDQRGASSSPFLPLGLGH